MCSILSRVVGIHRLINKNNPKTDYELEKQREPNSNSSKKRQDLKKCRVATEK